MSKADLKVTFDHDEIRRWAEERNAAPACVRGTGSAEDIGMIRLDFPGYSGEQSLERIEWDEWFKKSDERNLALLYQQTTAAGVKSNFNKLLSRETAEGAEQYGHSELVGSGHKKKAGESTPRQPYGDVLLRSMLTANGSRSNDPASHLQVEHASQRPLPKRFHYGGSNGFRGTGCY